jgi:hypothetical protein
MTIGIYMYLNPIQLAMNMKYSRLHKSRPYSILFNRQPNELEDYSNLEPTLDMEKADTDQIEKRLAFAQQVVIPQISKIMREQQDKDHQQFEKKHRIIKDMYPIGSTVMIKNVNRSSKLEERFTGPFTVKGYTKNKSYILVDQQNNLLSRDIPTHHIKLIHAAKPSQNETKEGHYEVQAVVAHRGTAPHYEYLVHWLGYDDERDFTWEPIHHFDSKLHIELYWDRRNASQGTNLATTVNNASRKRATRDKHSNKNNRVIKRSQRLLSQ